MTRDQWAAIQDTSDVADGLLTERMGVEITQWDMHEMIGTMPVAGNRQPFGLLHGGANAVLAESLGSLAATLHAATIGKIAVGLELSCTHHRSVSDGLVTGVCRPISLGRTVATLEIVITDEQGRRACTARLTCILRDRQPGDPQQTLGGRSAQPVHRLRSG